MIGAAAVFYETVWLWIMAAFYGMLWVSAVRQKEHTIKRQILFGILFITVLFLGCFCSYRQKLNSKSLQSFLHDGEKCMVQGEIYKRKQEKNSTIYYLKNCKMQYHQKIISCDQILLHLNTEGYFIGEILCVEGNIQTFSLPKNEGNYSEKAYYESLGITCLLNGEKVLFVKGRASVLRESLCHFNEKMQNVFLQAMPEAQAGVMAAMTLGEKSLMDTETKKLFQSAGVSHFYSISGLHITLLGMALYHFLRKRGATYLSAGIVGAGCMLFYGELIGFGISASRAIGMFLLLLYAKFRGRSYDRVTALSLVAVIMVAEHPYYLKNAGFLLSFGAVAGVVAAEYLRQWTEYTESREKGENLEQESGKSGNRIKKYIRDYLWKIQKNIKDFVRVSICIQIITIPVLSSFFYEISVYSILANAIIIPGMTILLGFGIAGGLMGLFLPFAGKCILFPCHLILLLFEAVCKLVNSLPFAVWITGKMSVGKILCWYSLFGMFLWVRKNHKKMPLVVLCPFFCLLLWYQKMPAFEMDFLDVGQGDGIYISAGEGTNCFIDGGSTDVTAVGTYRILPFFKVRGIRKIDYWFVSHCDADHISGLMEILESGYPVSYLVVSAYIPEDEAWLHLKELAEEYDTKIIRMNPKDKIAGGGQKSKDGFEITCLYPLGADSIECTDRNAASLVLLYESASCTAFFGGDMGIQQEKELISSQKLQKVDVYKASHHGSAASNSREFLARIRPDIAVISCALKNNYGHPAKEALEHLEEVGARIYETRSAGQIKITGTHLEEDVISMLKSSYEND